MASKLFNFSTNGTSMPVGGAVTESTIVNTTNNPVSVENSINLTTSYQSISVPLQSTFMTLYNISTNTSTITVAGSSGDVGLNLGVGWVYAHYPLAGTSASLVWAKATSGSPLYYQFN